jgi:hypothetical protein
MSPKLSISGVSRRALLSALAVLPALSGSLRSMPARAQTAASGDTLPSWNAGNAKQAILNFVTAVTREGSPVGINEYIGRRPIAAFGNSDGDLEMLQWTTMAGGSRFGLIVHHTDAEREYAFDRNSPFGHLDKALDAAAVNKWTVVDMKNDWKRIFAFE